jgi:hypothetical protein
MERTTTMKLSSKTALLILTVIMTIPIFKGAIARMGEYNLNLPKTVGVWTRTDSVQIIDSKWLLRIKALAIV